MPGRASGHQKFVPIPMDRQLPEGDMSISGDQLIIDQVNSCKVSPKVGCSGTLGQP